MTAEELAEIKARVDAITIVGPWRATNKTVYGTVRTDDYAVTVVRPGISSRTGEPYVGPIVARSRYLDTAEFIAHAREDIPALLAEVERLQTELQAYKDDPFKGLRSMGYHNVEADYGLDPCENGHIFTWTTGNAGDPMPEELRCGRCHKMIKTRQLG